MSSPAKVPNQQQAAITLNQDNYHHKIYSGITETKFKQRYANHIKSFRHEKHQSDTELSNELWSIKNNNYTPNIAWEILREHQTYDPNTKRCSLCLNEKLEIAKYKGYNLLNKRSEIINKCRHQKKFAWVCYDSKDWIWFSVTAFEQLWARGRSFPGSDRFRSSWIQLGFGNQCFPVVVSLFGDHAHEVTVSPSLVAPQLRWDWSDCGS